eukprot:Awhi_evm1s14725
MSSNTLQFSDDRTCNCDLQCPVSLESFHYKCNMRLNVLSQSLRSTRSENNLMDDKIKSVGNLDATTIENNANEIPSGNTYRSSEQYLKQAEERLAYPKFIYNSKRRCEPTGMTNNINGVLNGPSKRKISITKLKGENFGIGMANIGGQVYIVHVNSGHFVNRTLFRDEPFCEGLESRSDALSSCNSTVDNSPIIFCDQDNDNDFPQASKSNLVMGEKVYRQTPAYKCGLSFGDRIVSVNHIATKTLNFQTISNILNSSERVTLEIINTNYFSIKREDCLRPFSKLTSEKPRPEGAGQTCDNLRFKNYLESKSKNLALSEWKKIFFETLGFEIENKVISSVASDSYASRSGLRVGDMIVSVEGQSCLNFSDVQILDSIRQHLRKKNASEIIISVIPQRLYSPLILVWSSLGLPEHARSRIPFVSSNVVHCYQNTSSKKRNRKLFKL